MIQAQNLIPVQVKPVQVNPDNCTGARFSFRYESSLRCHVNAARLFVPEWNRSSAMRSLQHPIQDGVTITSADMKCPFM